MKCEECKFEWDSSDCKNSCDECIYKNIDYLKKPCNKCGRFVFKRKVIVCNFEPK